MKLMENNKIIEEAFNNIDPKSKLRVRLYTDMIEFKTMSSEEVDRYRIKSYLSFEEEDIIRGKEFFESAKYLNKKGEEVDCKILLRRDNGEIIVVNQNGVKVCLTEDKLI